MLYALFYTFTFLSLLFLYNKEQAYKTFHTTDDCTCDTSNFNLYFHLIWHCHLQESYATTSNNWNIKNRGVGLHFILGHSDITITIKELFKYIHHHRYLPTFIIIYLSYISWQNCLCILQLVVVLINDL